MQVHVSQAVVCGRCPPGAARPRLGALSSSGRRSPLLRSALRCFPGRQPCAWRRGLPDGTWVGGTGGRWGVSPCLPLATPLPHGFFREASLAELFRSLLLADICNTMLSVAEIPFLNALPGPLVAFCLPGEKPQRPLEPLGGWNLLFCLCCVCPDLAVEGSWEKGLGTCSEVT